jgi:branched-chain amino acid aminotransferase
MTFGQGKIWFDGKMVDWADANVHVMAHVIHYGSSVFESMRCYKNEKGSAIFRAAEHVNRIYDSAKIYRMEIPYTQEEFLKASIESVKVNGYHECYIRPVVFRGLGSIGVNPLKNEMHCAIAAWEWGTYLGEGVLENGVSVCFSSWSRAAGNTFPAMAKAGGNYINSQLMKMEAVLNGYDEAIALEPTGSVSEGSGENIFIIKNGVIHTPELGSGILEGITRDSVMVIAEDLGYKVVEGRIPRESLYIADEVFFTGTAAELTPITKIDQITIADGKRGPITKQIQDRFFNIIRGKEEDKFNWLLYI